MPEPGPPKVLVYSIFQVSKSHVQWFSRIALPELTVWTATADMLPFSRAIVMPLNMSGFKFIWG